MSPYLIQGPAIISFSGGRTSGFMLHEIIAAHGGALPADVIPAFANTGKEREETLRFVHECGSRWRVDIKWIEWRRGESDFEQVGIRRRIIRDRPEVADWWIEQERSPSLFDEPDAEEYDVECGLTCELDEAAA